MYKLYDHQQRIVDMNRKKFGIFTGLGGGKTITALALAKKNNVYTLIIVPKPVRNKWEKAMEKMEVKGDVYTREEFKKMVSVIPGELYGAIIVDEAHAHFATLKALGHKKLMWFIKKWQIENIWLLTGTPYTSSVWSVYGLAKVLGHDWNYFTFQQRFFTQQWLGRRTIPVQREGIEDEVAELVNKIGDVVSLQDCVDVPDQIIDVEHFEMTKEQKDANAKILAEESGPLVRVTKYHQIASGTLKGNEFVENSEFKSEKNDRIVEYAENNKKLIVFSRYNLHLELIAKELTKKKIPHGIINGHVKDKESLIGHAEMSDRFVLLINASCSVGYELPSFPLVLFASLSYSFVDYVQAMGRVLRINALKKNVYKILLTSGTVDEAIWRSIQKKQSFNDAIFIKEHEQS